MCIKGFLQDGSDTTSFIFQSPFGELNLLSELLTIHEASLLVVGFH